MTDVPQTLSLIVQAQEYRGDIIRQINRRVTLLKLLRITRGSGKNVAWAAQGDGQLAENYSEGADAANFGSDEQNDAILSWGLYRSNFHVTKLALDSAATTVTPAGNRQLWARNQVDAAGALADLIEDDLFNGAGTGTLIAGLDVAVADDTNTYATIVRGTDTWWKPTIVDPGSLTAPTIAQIRSDLGTIFDACGETPDIAVASTAVFNAVANLFEPNRRWNIVNTARGAITLNAGFEGIEVDGCMFVKARHATANQIYYLNTNYVHVETLPDSEVPLDVLDRVQADDGFGSVPLDMTFHPLAENGPAKRAEALCTCQLVVKKPNSCGARLNVAA
jgi:hypothetical protein